MDAVEIAHDYDDVFVWQICSITCESESKSHINRLELIKSIFISNRKNVVYIFMMCSNYLKNKRGIGFHCDPAFLPLAVKTDCCLRIAQLNTKCLQFRNLGALYVYDIDLRQFKVFYYTFIIIIIYLLCIKYIMHYV